MKTSEGSPIILEALDKGLLDGSNINLINLYKTYDKNYTYTEIIDLVNNLMKNLTSSNVCLLLHDGTNLEDVCIKFLCPSLNTAYSNDEECYAGLYLEYLKCSEDSCMENVYKIASIMLQIKDKDIDKMKDIDNLPYEV